MKIAFNRPFIVGKELYYIAQSVLNGHISGDGPFTKKCNSFLESYLSAKKVLLTTSCTSALEISALLCDIQPGDEFIVPSFTFVSTANAFCLRGGIPKFVDIRPDTLNINERFIEKEITDRTKAIVPVHYSGVACEMDEIMAIARKHRLMVVEDSAQAIGCSYKGKALGTIGDVGCLSFHETKNIICGEGGALIANNDRLLERAEILREKGTNRSKFFRGEVDKYTWVDIGSSYLPSDMLAAFLYAQLENIQSIIDERKIAWNRYYSLLNDLSTRYGFGLPPRESITYSNGHLFYIITESESHRDALIAHLKNNGIYAVFHYVPLHTSPMGEKYGYRKEMLPITEGISSRLLRLPMYYCIGPHDQEYICNAINSFYLR
jgi:dTDP-4-amino-4,6-dideoxygalactose transaminase